MTDKPLKPQKGVWMAFSAAGYPAMFIGCFCFRAHLRKHYRETFGSDLERAGYRAARVTITPQRKAKP
jgi:hypothetical protein